MYLRNWEDFVEVDEEGFIVQHRATFDASGIDWSAISARLGQIEATPTPIPGNLDGVEEGDLIEVNLVAGQTYSFDYRGAPGGVVDPYLALFNGSLTTVLAEDDDGGLGRGSMITFTPSESGTYYLYATSFYTVDGEDPSVDAGDYTINMWMRETDVPGSANVAASLPTAAALGLGTYYGNIDAAGDNDYYAVNVSAGQAYIFTLAGGAASNPEFAIPGNTAATLTLYNAAGTSLGSNLNFESSVSYFATTDTTIYVRAAGLGTTTGGYTLDVVEVDPSTRDPLESLNWDSADNIDTVLVDGVPTAYVYFGGAGENFGEAVVNQGWQPHQIAAVMNALEEYTPITGINYEITTDVNQAEFRMITVTTATYGARFYPQDPAYGTQQGIGTFNLGSGGFGAFPQSLDRGGFSYAVILHEFGHAHGVAHPHDTGGGSEIMLGVNGSTGSLGVYNLNQGVYTVMSYNDAWPLHPDGPSAFTVAGIDNGWSATLGAFDIAVLQARYGVHDHNTGDNVYALTDVTDDAFYQTIWDSGGTDTIAYGGTFNAQIDLTAATLDYSPTGGGVVSFVRDIKGGFTIAGGILIENATSGEGDDVLIGNGVANVLTANGGNDFLMGGLGGDTLRGGAGFDTASYREAASGVSASLTSASGNGSGSGGEAAGDSFTGIEELEGSEFNDTLTSGNGGHTLTGLGGNDNLSGGNHNDTLDGGDGNDSLSGGNHEDVLNGGAGNDTLSGGNHDDILNGGAGDDVLTGGNHDDVFAFTEIGGTDRITDFKRGDDEIDLSAIDAVTGGADNAFTFIGAGAFTGDAGQLRSYSMGGDKFLAGDVNGDGVADFTIQTNILIVPSDLVL